MSFRPATNYNSLQSQRFLQINNDKLKSSFEKLSSGSRINRASDDAAGLAISEKMRSQISSTDQALRNSADVQSLLQVADGAMNETNNILIRLRQVAMQTASDTVTDSERLLVDMEVQQLKSEIDRISKTTSFNNIQLLDGTSKNLSFQIGIGSASKDRMEFNPQKISTTLENLKISDLNSQTKESSQEMLGHIDLAINYVNGNRAELGALQNRIQASINNLGVSKENLAQSNSMIRDANIALEAANMSQSRVMSKASTAVLTQANKEPEQAIKLL